MGLAERFRAECSEHWRLVLDLCRRIAAAGGRAHLVGGVVRDALLGEPAVDFDLEVFRLAAERLREVVAARWEFDLVGQSFGVLKLKGLPVDLALPRRETKVAAGHRGFDVAADPELSFADAAARRDFTINAIAWEPLADELVDPWGGRADLERRVLRHTSPRFAEDPLRVLRGMQFVARFDLRAEAATVALCRTMTMEGLAPERVFSEWKKLLLRGRAIGRGLLFLEQTGWVAHTPELAALVGCPQDPEWHPEGDVWLHTGFVLDAFARERLGDADEDLVVGLGCLCHDLGKPATTVVEGGRVRSPGHEEAGVVPTRRLLERFTNQRGLADEVVPLVAHHLKPRQLHEAGASDAGVRRLARRVGRIDRLVRVARADEAGRPPRPFSGFPAGDWLLAQAERLRVAAQRPRPLVLGRHLVARGLAPGPSFAPLLERCFEAQLDGRFDDEAGGLDFLVRLLDQERGGSA